VVFKKHMENMIYRNRNVRTTKKDLIIWYKKKKADFIPSR
jgi:hypothetical protein